MPPTISTTSVLFTLDQAAQIMGIPRRRVREMVHAGKLPAVSIGPRTKRIDPAVLAAWLADRAQPARED